MGSHMVVYASSWKAELLEERRCGRKSRVLRRPCWSSKGTQTTVGSSETRIDIPVHDQTIQLATHRSDIGMLVGRLVIETSFTSGVSKTTKVYYYIHP
jgi:hypothetical protein